MSDSRRHWICLIGTIEIIFILVAIIFRHKLLNFIKLNFGLVRKETVG